MQMECRWNEIECEMKSVLAECKAAKFICAKLINTISNQSYYMQLKMQSLSKKCKQYSLLYFSSDIKIFRKITLH